MTVHQHKDRKKKDKYLYYYEFQFMGERRKKSGFLTRRDTDKTEEAEKQRIERIKSGDYKLDEEFNTYIKNWLNIKRDLGENTKENYQTLLKKHILPFFTDYRVNTVKPIDMQRFIDHLYDKGLSSSSVKKNYSVINSIYNQLVKVEILKSNPCNKIEKPKEENAKIEVFDEKELDEFLKFADGYTRYAFAFKLAVTTGMRRGEILTLNWTNVDL